MLIFISSFTIRSYTNRLSLFSYLLLRNKQRRINHCAIQDHTPVQMRPGGAAGHAGEAELLAFADGITIFHIELIEVAVHGDQAVAVVDKDGFAVEEVIIHREYGAGCAGHDGGAACNGNIQAGMG